MASRGGRARLHSRRLVSPSLYSIPFSFLTFSSLSQYPRRPSSLILSPVVTTRVGRRCGRRGCYLFDARLLGTPPDSRGVHRQQRVAVAPSRSLHPWLIPPLPPTAFAFLRVSLRVYLAGENTRTPRSKSLNSDRGTRRPHTDTLVPSVNNGRKNAARLSSVIMIPA